MRFLEKIRSKLTMAIMLKDDLTPEKQVIGDVFLKTPGTKKFPIRHATGYFLLLDIPEGKCSIIAGGRFYKEQDFIVDTKSLDPKQPVTDLVLKPKANYPFPAGTTILKGKIVDNDSNPIFGVLIKIKNMVETATSEDDGSFLIYFGTITNDKKITLNIKKNGFKPKRARILLKKGSVIYSEVKLTVTTQ
ncbi:hypothetical protein KKE26_12620 [bacterium]|nr:hypothetical protein [bacterium]MBU1754570.1 hypothetical protein [bacterium]